VYLKLAFSLVEVALHMISMCVSHLFSFFHVIFPLLHACPWVLVGELHDYSGLAAVVMELGIQSCRDYYPLQ
jgi:hypothetical protein